MKRGYRWYRLGIAALLPLVSTALAADPAPRLAALLKELPGDGAPLRAQLLALDATDVRALCGLLTAPGTGGDAPARYALHGLALAVADEGQEAKRATFVQTLSDALAAEPAPADPAFLREQLRLAGASEAAAARGDFDLDTLRAATAAGTRSERASAIDALLAYAARVALAGKADAAAKMYRDLLAEHRGPDEVHIRCAALHGLANLPDGAGLADVLVALADDEAEVRAAAADAVARAPGPATTQACIAALPTTKSRAGRALLVEVLDRRGDPAALPGVLEALGDDDQGVRIAAVQAVATLGGQRAVGPLIGLLTAASPELRAAVRDALMRIPGEDTSDLIGRAISMVTAADSCVTLLDVLSHRSPTGDLEPMLLSAVDADVRVRVAALNALAVLAAAADLPRVLPLLAKAREDDERSAAEQAVASIALRAADREQAASQLIETLGGRSPSIRASLLRVLGRLGGTLALETVTAGLTDQDGLIVEAAVRSLADWPDAAPAALALQFATDTQDQKLHVLALRAYVRLAGLDRDVPAEERVRRYQAALNAARRPDERKLTLARLGEIADTRAVQILEPYLTDAALAAEAGSAIVKIADALLPLHWHEADEALKRVLSANPPPDVRAHTQQVLKRLDQFDGLILDWWVAGPYMTPGRQGHELFEVPFAPEPPGQPGSAWNHQPLESEAQDAWRINLLLNGPLAGDDRAAYLFTRIHSPVEQPARLELGSDDGLKAWLNDELIHANNALRGVRLGDDQVAVTLRAGWNRLLLKVTNDGGGWAACARLRAPDGSRLNDVYAEAGEKP